MDVPKRAPPRKCMEVKTHKATINFFSRYFWDLNRSWPVFVGPYLPSFNSLLESFSLGLFYRDSFIGTLFHEGLWVDFSWCPGQLLLESFNWEFLKWLLYSVFYFRRRYHGQFGSNTSHAPLMHWLPSTPQSTSTSICSRFESPLKHHAFFFI